jgi:hypothetical protein
MLLGDGFVSIKIHNGLIGSVNLNVSSCDFVAKTLHGVTVDVPELLETHTAVFILLKAIVKLRCYVSVKGPSLGKLLCGMIKNQKMINSKHQILGILLFSRDARYRKGLQARKMTGPEDWLWLVFERAIEIKKNYRLLV